MEFPKFTGEDPINWRDMAEQYFELKEIRERDCNNSVLLSGWGCTSMVALVRTKQRDARDFMGQI